MPVYLRLFDFLLKMDQYDEAAVKNAFQGEPCLRQFTRIKNYLFERLLSSLRQFHAENSVHRKCMNALDAVELLFDRQLFHQARLQLRKAVKIAESYELTETMPAIFAWERKLIKQKGGPRALELLAALEPRERSAHIQLDQERQWTALYDNLLYLSKNRREVAGNGLQSLPDSLSHPLLQENHLDLSFTAAVARELCQALASRLQGDMQGSHEQYRRALRHWEENRHMCVAFPDRYLRVAAAFLYSCHGIGDYADFDPLLSRIREDRELPGVQKTSILVTSYNLRLLYHLNQGPLDAGAGFAEALQNELQNAPVPLSARISAHMNLASFHFLMEDFAASYRHLRNIIDLPRGEEVSDLRELARSMVLIVHLELGNEELIPYALRSMLRFARSRRPHNALETSLKNFLVDIDHDPGAHHRRKALRTLVVQLSGNDLPGVREIQLWAQSRQENVPIAALLSRSMAEAPGSA